MTLLDSLQGAGNYTLKEIKISQKEKRRSLNWHIDSRKEIYFGVMKKEGDEIMELKHDPEPGYRTVLYIVMAVASLYLAIILLKTI